MKITKFEHACLVVEEHGQSIIIDPGVWTTNLIIPDNVAAIVVTHNHQDHLHRTLINEIVHKNPKAIVVAHRDLLSELEGLNVTTVLAHEKVVIGSFALEFFGGQHATIRPDWPPIANLGVLVNDSLYYPGDSFAEPGRPVTILALPVSAPWLKFSEVADFLLAVRPSTVFPVHDAILSGNGKQLLDMMTKSIADSISANYRRIDDESLSL